MAISQTSYWTPGAFVGDLDFSPLNRLGEQIKQSMQEADAARMIEALDGRMRNQQPAYLPQQYTQEQPAKYRPATNQDVPLWLQSAMTGNNYGGAPATTPPATAVAAASPEPAAAPASAPQWLTDAQAGNYNPAPARPAVDPRSPFGRLLARLGKGPSADSVPAPFPVAGASPVQGLPPENAVAVAPEPSWYNPQVARALNTFGGGAPPEPGAAQPPFPAPLPGAATAVAENVPLPRPRPATPDYALPPTAAAPAERYPEAGEPSSRGLDTALRVIRQKESGGNYGNVTTTRNPRTGQMQSALGAYGVMDFNVGPWTKEALGREMSPEDFLRNKAAQDAVARFKFGQYAQKYGTTGAARAWFAGEGGMNNPNARDALGTTVSAYADDFERKAGGNLPPEIMTGASRGGAPEPQQAMALDATGQQAPQQVAANATPAQRVYQNLSSPQVSATDAEITSAELAALYRNPITRPLANAFLQKRLDPGTYKFMQAGDNLVRYNERDGTYAVIPSGKLHTVKEDDKLVDASGRVVYGGDNDSGRFGKLGANMRWVDVNDKSKGQEPIPGTTPTQLPAEVAFKLGLGEAFLTRLPSIKQQIEADKLGIDVNPAAHLASLAGVGPAAEVKRQIESGADSLLRMLTGAGMGVQEAEKYVKRYEVNARDTKDQLLSKMQQLEEDMHFAANRVGQGRGGSPLGHIKRAFGSSGSADSSTARLGPLLGGSTPSAPSSPGTAQQLEVGKTYYGRRYLGGPPGNPNSWSVRVQ